VFTQFSIFTHATFHHPDPDMVHANEQRKHDFSKFGHPDQTTHKLQETSNVCFFLH
jgi:hypothetical protein